MLASRGKIDTVLLLELLMGTGLVIASACVVNNYIDRDIDAVMERTKDRALASGEVAGFQAIFFATILGLGGFITLAYFTNWLTFALGAAAYVLYVAVYGIAKRRTVHGTLVGSISGALPPVAGYTSVTNGLELGAWLLFLILVCWQMPHFYAIAIYRYKDYKAAKLPVISVKLGINQAKKQVLAYIMAFVIASALLTAFGYTGYTYLIVMLLVGSLWLGLALRPATDSHSTAWARQIFMSSLYVILVLDIMLVLDPVLP